MGMRSDGGTPTLLTEVKRNGVLLCALDHNKDRIVLHNNAKLSELPGWEGEVVRQYAKKPGWQVVSMVKRGNVSQIINRPKLTVIEGGLKP